MESSLEEDLLLNLERCAGPDPVLDWKQVFGNAHPVEIEIGIGKGRFLIHAAQEDPQVNYLGIEWASKYLRLAHERCRRRQLRNVRLVRAEALEFVEFFVPARSVRAFHLYFPDPWPKKKHHKRRLFNAEFLAEAERALEPGGRLWLATDHEDYFQAMLEVLAQSRSMQPLEAQWSGARTNYEEKYLSQGKAIWRQVVEKVR